MHLTETDSYKLVEELKTKGTYLYNTFSKHYSYYIIINCLNNKGTVKEILRNVINKNKCLTIK